MDPRISLELVVKSKSSARNIIQIIKIIAAQFEFCLFEFLVLASDRKRPF